MKTDDLFGPLSVLVLATLAEFVAGAPQSSSSNFRRDGLPPVPPEYDPDKDVFERYISKRCTTNQIADDLYGWAEAGVLATATSGWKPGSDYQNAFDMYMGTDSDSNSGVFWSYRQRISNAVNNQKGIHDGTRSNTVGNLGGTRYQVFVFCDEDESPWPNTCSGFTGAYTWWKQWNYWSVYLYVVLCPDVYFSSTNLADQLRAVRDEPSKATTINNIYWNKGHIWFHESFHWPWMITNPQAFDYDPDDTNQAVYGPAAVKAEASSKNAYGTSVIADTYSVTGLAMVMMQIFKLSDPPKPATGASSLTTKFTDVRTAPDSWTITTQGNVNSNTSYAPDASAWLVTNATRAKINMSDYAVVSSISSVSSSASSSTSTAASTATPCQGNQVEVSGCAAGSLPSSTPYSGVKTPSCVRADGDAGSQPRLNDSKAQAAAADYCSQLISKSVVLSAKNSDYAPYTEPGVAENGASMSLTVLFDVEACPTDKSKTTLDFKALGQTECYQNMYTAIAEVCAQDSTWKEYNKDFTLEGGVFENDCGLWALTSN